MSLLIFFQAPSRPVPVDVGELELRGKTVVAGATTNIDAGNLSLTGNDFSHEVRAYPTAGELALRGAPVYVNTEQDYWHACVNLHVTLRSLQRQLDRNTTAFQNDPSDLNAARLSYNEEAIAEVERAIELCREWQSFFSAVHVRPGEMSLVGNDVYNEKRADIINVAMLLSSVGVSARLSATIDTGGATVVDVGDAWLIVYESPGDYALTVTKGGPVIADYALVGGGGIGGRSINGSNGVVLGGGGGGGGEALEGEMPLSGVTPITVGVKGSTDLYATAAQKCGQKSVIGDVTAWGGEWGRDSGSSLPTSLWFSGMGGPSSKGTYTGGPGTLIAAGGQASGGVGGGTISTPDPPSRGGGGGGSGGGTAGAAGFHGSTTARAAGGAGLASSFGELGRGGDGGCGASAGTALVTPLVPGGGGQGGELINGGVNATGGAGADGRVYLRINKLFVDAIA